MSEAERAEGLVAREGTGWPLGAPHGGEATAAALPVRSLASGPSQSTAGEFLDLVSRFGESFAKHETLGGWQRAISSLGRECRDQFGSLALLGEALKFSRGRLGAFWRRNCEGSNSPTSGAPPKFSRELLPVSLPAAREYLAAMQPSPVGEEGAGSWRVEASRYWALIVVALLGYHATAGWTSKEVGGPPQVTLIKSQEAMLRHIFNSCYRMLGGEIFKSDVKEAVEDLKTRRTSYGGESVSKLRELDADKVIPAWPSADRAGILPVADFVDGELRDDILDANRCLLPRSQWPDRTPRSRVHATDAEWYRLVKEGLKRGIFEEVAEDKIFRNQHGEMVLNGAMGVDKFKKTEAGVSHLLRFICIFVPANAYLRSLRGDAHALPYLGQLGLWLLEDDEVILTDSEDMESCFNLFAMPSCWLGLFAFEKEVPRSVVGGPPNEMMRVAMRTVPMGWVGAVDLMQAMARRLVFKTCSVDPKTELHKEKPMPKGDELTVVCMDGVDHLRKVKAAAAEMQETDSHKRFAEVCAQLGLPLNEGKRLIAGSYAGLLGGELDGVAGVLSHARDKNARFLTKSVALCSLRSWSAPVLQHWTGLFCFGAGFRRPTFSILQEVFVLIAGLGDEESHPPTHSVLDEVLAGALMSALFCSDLRAQIRRTISSTDASEEGGGAAEASRFVEAASPLVQESSADWRALLVEESATRNAAPVAPLRCAVCAGDSPSWGVWAPCAALCEGQFCSTSCLVEHGTCYDMKPTCKGKGLFLPRFAEGFAGPRGPATWAVAAQGVAIAPPLDRLMTGSAGDFFTEEGHANFEKAFNDPSVAWEHWGPECKLMSRARGRPIALPGGRTVAGPQPVRNERFPLGFPWLRGRMAQRVERSNQMAMHSLERLRWRVQNWGFCVIEHPRNSWLWKFPLAQWLQELPGVFFTVWWNCCHGGDRVKASALLHNCPLLHEALHQPECAGHADKLDYQVKRLPDGTLEFDTALEAEYPFGFCLVYAQVVRRALGAWHKAELPAELSVRSMWVQEALGNSTKRLQRDQVQLQVAPQVLRMLRGMEQGKEAEHLADLLRLADYRGSDVRLCSAELVDGCRQEAPYPSPAWRWETVQAYKWEVSHHINVLELTAFLNYLRSKAGSVDFHGKRVFNVFDSRVAACVVAKGRSSSKVLNRVCRRVMALSLATNTYVITLWTISKWQYSDAASRLHSDAASRLPPRHG